MPPDEDVGEDGSDMLNMIRVNNELMQQRLSG